MLLLLYLSCQSNNIYESQFDGPNNAYVLENSQYYNHPVAFVTNQFSSKISPIDLKFEIPLSDQIAAPFLRTQGISTGNRRQLGDIVVFEKTLEENSSMVQIFTIDFFTKSLLMIPYLYIQDGNSFYPRPTFEPAFTLSEGTINNYVSTSVNEISFEDFSILDISSSEATTEIWSFVYEDSIDAFVVEGTKSGRQEGFAYLGSEYTSDSGAIHVQLSSNIRTDKPIYLETDTGIVEHNLNGIPLSFSKHPTKPLVAVVMKQNPLVEDVEFEEENTDTNEEQDTDSSLENPEQSSQITYEYWISIFNLDHQREVITIFPDNPAHFESFIWDINNEENTHNLYAADLNDPILHQITISDSFVEEYENRPEPFVIELADETNESINENVDWSEYASPEIFSHITIAKPLSNATGGGSQYESLNYNHLYAGTNSGYLYIFDIRSSQWRHINPNSSESKGMFLESPITGLATTKDTFYFPTVNNFGGREQDLGVIATTFDGSIYLIKAQNGCIGTISGGPTIEEVSSYSDDSATFNDRGASSNPSLYDAQGNGDRIIVNQCGGVVKDENWTVQYQENDGNWMVEGSVSGIQDERVFTNQRYQSDEGEISFTIVSGTRPETDGDTFTFSTESNLLSFDRITNNSGQIESIQIPSRPKTFEYSIGESDGAWDPILDKQGVVIPLVNSNIVIRIDIEEWEIDAVWN